MIGHLYLGRYALGRRAERRPCAPQAWTPRRQELAQEALGRKEPAQTPFKLDDQRIGGAAARPC